MSGHTSGPWVISNSGNPIFGAFTIRQDPENWDGMGYQHICSAPADSKDSLAGQMFRANANLIAAAPDLLAALKDAERVQEARLFNLLDDSSYEHEVQSVASATREAEAQLIATRAAIAKAEGRDVSGGVG